MSVMSILLKIAGKGNMKIDKSISTFYLLRVCVKFAFMLLRGFFVSLLYKDISPIVFIGSNVQLIERRKMKIGAKTKIHNSVKIDALSTNGVQIGEKCVLGRNTVIECTGSLSYVGHGVRIGNNTSFGNDCFLGAAGGIEIGDDVIAGQYIRFHSENHCYSDSEILIKDQGVTHKGIKIGNNCWIGSGAVFLDGASVGNGCVIAANAVVTKSFPDNSIIGGVPAKLLKSRVEG